MIASSENVIICAGFVHGLALICRVLRERGGDGGSAIEAYGHLLHQRDIAGPGHADGVAAGRRARRRAAARATSAGPCRATVARGRADAGASVPARHDARARPPHRVRPVGGRTGGVIVEDDYDGEFRFDRQPVGAMQALAPEHVVYAGTASKSLAPGLRLGWLVVPDSMIDEVVTAKELSGGANGRSRAAHPRRVDHLRRLRPADPPVQARLPAPPGPAHRRAAARTRPRCA